MRKIETSVKMQQRMMNQIEKKKVLEQKQ